MKTKQQNQIILKDGRSRIGEWTSETGNKLTVGDRIELPHDVAAANEGYGPGAVVARVEYSGDDGLCHIEAEADCRIPANNRTVVTLNASRVENPLRAGVETLVRKRVELPLLEWEDSFESSPVVRLHQLGDRGNGPKASLLDLQQEVSRLLADSLQPAGL